MTKYEINPDILTEKTIPTMTDRFILLYYCVNELADLNENVKELTRVIRDK